MVKKAKMPKIGKIMTAFMSALLCFAFTLTGCQQITDALSEKATVSGTITLPAAITAKPYTVIVDTDEHMDNGTTATVTGTANGSSIAYSLADIPAGKYYVWAAVSVNGTSASAMKLGDYLAVYGATSDATTPESPNVTVPETGTVTCDMKAWAISGSNDADDDSE